MGGFTDWVEQVADSKDALDYRKKVSRPGIGLDVAEPLLRGRTTRRRTAWRLPGGGRRHRPVPHRQGRASARRSFARLQEKEETVYVVPGSDAEEHVARRFPHKTIKRVGNGLRPRTIQRFLSGLPLTFQPGKAAKLNAVYHFTFTGKEEKQATVTIRDGTLQVQDGHQGEADLRVTADSETWLGFLAKERSLLWALLRRKIRIKGSPKLLVAFGKCFPS